MNPTQDTVPNPPPGPRGDQAPLRVWPVRLGRIGTYARHRRVRADLVSIPDTSFPESLSSIRDGTLYVGSLNLGGVVKVAPAGKAEQFIAPGAAASRSVLGVLADEKSGTLYVCPTI